VGGEMPAVFGTPPRNTFGSSRDCLLLRYDKAVPVTFKEDMGILHRIQANDYTFSYCQGFQRPA
jgi:hypothetical protein